MTIAYNTLENTAKLILIAKTIHNTCVIASDSIIKPSPPNLSLGHIVLNVFTASMQEGYVSQISVCSQKGYPLDSDPRYISVGIPWVSGRGSFSREGGWVVTPSSLIPGFFPSPTPRTRTPLSLPLDQNRDTPPPWTGPGQVPPSDSTRTGVLPPPPRHGHSTDRIRSGRYASCIYAGGISCFETC